MLMDCPHRSRPRRQWSNQAAWTTRRQENTNPTRARESRGDCAASPTKAFSVEQAFRLAPVFKQKQKTKNRERNQNANDHGTSRISNKKTESY